MQSFAPAATQYHDSTDNDGERLLSQLNEGEIITIEFLPLEGKVRPLR